MTIVKFSNGKFGIRKFSLPYFGYVYKDFDLTSGWWGKDSSLFRYCQTDEKTARKTYSDILMEDEVVL